MLLAFVSFSWLAEEVNALNEDEGNEITIDKQVGRKQSSLCVKNFSVAAPTEIGESLD